jgi:hypothetical protein
MRLAPFSLPRLLLPGLSILINRTASGEDEVESVIESFSCVVFFVFYKKSSSSFLLKSFHLNCARAITSPEWAFMRHKEKLANRCVSETSEQGSLSIKSLP